MQIVRLAESRRAPRVRPAALGLAVLLNGGLLALVAVSRSFAPPHDDAAAPIEVELIELEPEPRPPALPEEAGPERKPEPPKPPVKAPASAPKPGPLTAQPEAEGRLEPASGLWSLVCIQIPAELRDQRPECRDAGDPFALHEGPVTAGGLADQSLRERALGDFLGGRFAGKDRYQIEVMLGLRSTGLGTKYHVPVERGPADEAVDHTDTDRIVGPSSIPEG